MKLLEIEIDGLRNPNLVFLPLQRTIRGRFDFNRMPEEGAKARLNKYPEPIPSQRLGLDLDAAIGYIAEPIYGMPALKAKIEKDGRQLPPEKEVFENIDVPTWLFWIRRACESGVAKVVAGELPAKIVGEPQKSFYTTAPKTPNVNERLAAAMEANTAIMAKLFEKLSAK